MCGKFVCENLGLSKNWVEWLHFHVKIQSLKTECFEMCEYIVKLQEIVKNVLFYLSFIHISL